MDRKLWRKRQALLITEQSTDSFSTLTEMAMIHDSVIGDQALIGIQSMICDHVVVGPQAITAEQTLVLKATEIPEGTIYAGSPARKIGNIEEKHRQAGTFCGKALSNASQPVQFPDRSFDLNVGWHVNSTSTII